MSSAERAHRDGAEMARIRSSPRLPGSPGKPVVGLRLGPSATPRRVIR